MKDETLFQIADIVAEEKGKYAALAQMFNRMSPKNRQTLPEIVAKDGAKAVTEALTAYRQMDARALVLQVARTEAAEFPPARISERLVRHADETGGDMSDFNVVRLFPTLGHKKQIEVCERLTERGFALDGARVRGLIQR